MLEKGSFMEEETGKSWAEEDFKSKLSERESTGNGQPLMVPAD